MREKLQSLLTTICFCAVLFGLSLLCLLHPSAANSEAERRPLAQMPDFEWHTIKNGVYFTRFDDYTVDQFPSRDLFRGLKARFQLSVLHTSENNSLAVEMDSIAKINTKLNTASIENAADKLHSVYDTYLKNSDTLNYLCIIPDKGYFFAKDFSYPSIDYDTAVEYLTGELAEFSYINLFDILSLDDYYRTDTHWRQENLLPVAKLLARSMDNETPDGNFDIENYTVNEHYPFNGVYFGQSALNPQPDTLRYLSNDMLNDCTVYDYETGEILPIYNLDKLNSSEPYDVFLSGTKALLRIDNPNAASERELIVFRDSYGASLIPLLVGNYSSITLVDLRYINPSYLGNYLEFNNQDVLFLYSTLLLNESFALK